jgi:hypothetical protein
MNDVLCEHLDDFLVYYIDDILIPQEEILGFFITTHCNYLFNSTIIRPIIVTHK